MSSMETLKRHLPISGPEGLHELKKIVERFEEKIYSTATSQFNWSVQCLCKAAAAGSSPVNPN
uniref:Mediator complex subunit 15 KIX domain-containing protein n=1 Tax=Vitis vinifera TaxID=29760 RepID=F6I1Z4_VITVI